MTYEVKLFKSDDGYAVWCPALPGCWSQGETEDAALANIRDAISEYLAAEDDSASLVEAKSIYPSVVRITEKLHRTGAI